MARFQAGQGKPLGSGRRKGTVNKKTLALDEALASHGIDPIAQLAEALPQLSADRRVEALLDLMSYLYPKRKAVEVTGVEAASEPRVHVYLPANGKEAPEFAEYEPGPDDASKR
jgi:hypothetical protein